MSLGARLTPATLLAGLAAGTGTVAVHVWWWGVALGAAATVMVLVALPAGWSTRLPYALGVDGVVVLAAVPRGEGDYLVAATGRGYAVIGLAVVVLAVAVATLPRPGREIHRAGGGSSTLE